MRIHKRRIRELERHTLAGAPGTHRGRQESRPAAHRRAASLLALVTGLPPDRLPGRLGDFTRLLILSGLSLARSVLISAVDPNYV